MPTSRVLPHVPGPHAAPPPPSGAWDGHPGLRHAPAAGDMRAPPITPPPVSCRLASSCMTAGALRPTSLSHPLMSLNLSWSLSALPRTRLLKVWATSTSLGARVTGVSRAHLPPIEPEPLGGFCPRTCFKFSRWFFWTLTSETLCLSAALGPSRSRCVRAQARPCRDRPYHGSSPGRTSRSRRGLLALPPTQVRCLGSPCPRLGEWPEGTGPPGKGLASLRYYLKAAVTSDQNPGGLKQQGFVPSRFWKPGP